MKTGRVGKVILLFLISFIFCCGAMAQPSKEKSNISNLYTAWVKLALLGKNQAEIEYFFRNVDEESLGKIKERIRFAVLDNLRRSGIRSLIQKSTDADDWNVVIRKVITEIRYMGIEHDNDLKLSIKEEFGIVLESL